MSGSLNEVTLIGNVGQDPEIRSTQSGTRIANLSLATSESWNDKSSGEKRERTEWHRVAIFNDGLVGVVEKYVRKGSKIFVRGKLQTRKWQDQSGQDRYSTEVVLQQFGSQLILLGDSKGGSRPPPAESAEDYGSTRSSSGPGYSARHDNPDAARSSARGDLDSEIPF